MDGFGRAQECLPPPPVHRDNVLATGAKERGNAPRPTPGRRHAPSAWTARTDSPRAIRRRALTLATTKGRGAAAPGVRSGGPVHAAHHRAARPTPAGFTSGGRDPVSGRARIIVPAVHAPGARQGSVLIPTEPTAAR